MKKRTQKKLALAKETIKHLEGLEQAAGGKPYSYWTDCEYCYTCRFLYSECFSCGTV